MAPVKKPIVAVTRHAATSAPSGIQKTRSPAKRFSISETESLARNQVLQQQGADEERADQDEDQAREEAEAEEQQQSITIKEDSDVHVHPCLKVLPIPSQRQRSSSCWRKNGSKTEFNDPAPQPRRKTCSCVIRSSTSASNRLQRFRREYEGRGHRCPDYRLLGWSLQVKILRLRTWRSSSSGPVTFDWDLRKLSPLERERLKYILSIERNTFDPIHLPALQNIVLDPTGSSTIINQQCLEQPLPRNLSDASAFGNDPDIWSTNFIIYVSLMSMLHSEYYPRLVNFLLTFHSQIIRLAKIYKWQEAGLPLGIRHHQWCLSISFETLPSWEMSESLIEQYCRAVTKLSTSLVIFV
ncbi:uncharacterized protein PAC_14877 [Phialocephala subalpina]|uniref:Uncharacterized protein n=1 Tax=Phialocephala subalpina TaxID=576137 RepID=A0A1L7XJ41_9HELO|nr:uncharacterized protein PAC_14877 [Phialocephala subalpina]